MAITKCRECAGKVSTDAASCPHCGVIQPALKDGAASSKPVKSKTSFWRRLGLVLLALWIIGSISQLALQKKPDSISAAKPIPSLVAPIALTPATKCFDRGYDIASVYLENIKQAVNVGMLASEMMEKGCMQSVGNQGAVCVAECRLGFKGKAKQWVKDGSIN